MNVSTCHKLNDGMLRSALATCPELRTLDVSNCALVTDETLRQVAAVCQKLERLDTSHCPLVTFAVRGLEIRVTGVCFGFVEGVTKDKQKLRGWTRATARWSRLR